MGNWRASVRSRPYYPFSQLQIVNIGFLTRPASYEMCTVGKMPFEASNQGALIMRIIRCAAVIILPVILAFRIISSLPVTARIRGKFDALPQDLDPEFGELCK
jgi:hypothetical protein